MKHSFRYTFAVAVVVVGLGNCAGDRGELTESDVSRDANAGDGAARDSNADGTAAAVEGGAGDAELEATADTSTESGCSGSPGPGGCCPKTYDLTNDADTAGLCAPEEAMACNCLEWIAGTVECSPDGTACCYVASTCNPAPPCGWVDCWEGTPIAPKCPATQQMVDQAIQRGSCTACTSDSHCPSGQTCSLRLVDRMFCQP